MKKILLVILTLIGFIFFFIYYNKSSKNKDMVIKELSGTHNGKEVYLVTLINKAGNVVRLSSFGARLTWIEVPDKNGIKDNVIFGYDTFDKTIKGDPYFGAVIGRYANRIAKGEFTLDGVEYHLAHNDGVNSEHGGPFGWHSQVWETAGVKGSKFPAIMFTLNSPDMQEGYPGNMVVKVRYTWTDNNELIIDYTCSTDKKSVLNITNHAYFNLHGAGNGDILDHQVVIKASTFVVVDSATIPTGELRPVTGTPLDFTRPHAVGERIGEDYDQLILGKGYDHTFILDKKEPVDATVYDPQSGRMMEVLTDQPGIQFYTGNYLDGSMIGHGNKPYNYRSGLCLETGHYPDSPNHPEFPTTVLNSGETFNSQTIFRFSVKK